MHHASVGVSGFLHHIAMVTDTSLFPPVPAVVKCWWWAQNWEMKKTKRPNLQTSPCLMTMHYKHIGGLSECTWTMIWFYYCLWYMIAHSTIFILVLFINWVLTWCCFLRGGAAFQSLNVSKVIKASVFCFLASVQGYSSSIVNFSSVLKQADLWSKSAHSKLSPDIKVQ